uniref:Uncharacterized protein n=1 Tax=Myripristis murdjan TaxID=586833 RepID=A0A667YLH1_9TELE
MLSRWHVIIEHQGYPPRSTPREHLCSTICCNSPQGSLRNISILDRLLLSLPVWLQLSINPATALHILQREPPGVRVTHICSIPLYLALSFSVTHTHMALSNNLVVLLCRHSWCVSLVRPGEMCCVSVWQTTASHPLFSSLASGRNTPVRTSHPDTCMYADVCSHSGGSV